MSETLTNFLVDLACEPGRMTRFMADPEGANQWSEGLTDEEKEAVKTGDARKIRYLLVRDAAMPVFGPVFGKKKPGKKKKGAKKPSKKKQPASKRKGR